MYKNHSALFLVGFSLLSFSSYPMNTKTESEKSSAACAPQSQSAAQTATHNAAQTASCKAENENSIFKRFKMEVFTDSLFLGCFTLHYNTYKNECLDDLRESNKAWNEKQKEFRKALLNVQKRASLSDQGIRYSFYEDTKDVTYLWHSGIFKQEAPPSQEFYEFIMKTYDELQSNKAKKTNK